MAFFTAFKIVMLEGVEVIFIVIALGASGHLYNSAIFGAVIAFLLVLILGLALHRPLSHIPENTLKWGVGLLLTAFGTFWVGESLGLPWPVGDGSILLLLTLYFIIAQLLMLVHQRFAKKPPRTRIKTNTLATNSFLKIALTPLFKLFVDDASLAIGSLIWIGLSWLIVPYLNLTQVLFTTIFWLGLASLLSVSVLKMPQHCDFNH